MWKLSDVLLNRRAKETNTTFPHSDYITASRYPEQNHSLLKTVVNLDYNSEYTCNIHDSLGVPAVKIVDGEKVSLRPPDDHQFMHHRTIIDPDGENSKNIQNGDFVVLRADLAEPYVFIAVSRDCSVMIVSSTKINQMGHYEFLDNVTTYAIQLNEFFGQKVQTHYMNSRFIDDVYFNADILRIDSTNPCRVIIMEYYDDNKVRFILGDEVTVISNEPFDETNYVTDAMIPEYRKNLLEGKTIYG